MLLVACDFTNCLKIAHHAWKQAKWQKKLSYTKVRNNRQWQKQQMNTISCFFTFFFLNLFFHIWNRHTFIMCFQMHCCIELNIFIFIQMYKFALVIKKIKTSALLEKGIWIPFYQTRILQGQSWPRQEEAGKAM